jgi:hypothetical protein
MKRSAGKAIITLVELTAIPPVAALIVMIILRTHGYRTHYGLSFDTALNTAVTNCVDTIRQSTLGTMLVIINYVSLFGFPVVLTALANHWFHRKRAACFYLVSIGFLLIAAFITPNPLFVIKPPGESFDRWTAYLIQYPAYVLPIAILSGALFAMLPIWGPTDRYLLKRGLCPKCQYDLQGTPGGIDAGCPECGWNRPANDAATRSRMSGGASTQG